MKKNKKKGKLVLENFTYENGQSLILKKEEKGFRFFCTKNGENIKKYWDYGSGSGDDLEKGVTIKKYEDIVKLGVKDLFFETVPELGAIKPPFFSKKEILKRKHEEFENEGLSFIPDDDDVEDYLYYKLDCMLEL